jgi:hypothetical protein
MDPELIEAVNALVQIQKIPQKTPQEQLQKRVNQMKAVQEEGLLLFAKKNADYGDAFTSHGIPGVLMRMGDKLLRFQKISKTGVQLVNDEKLRDTLIDLHNYAAMAILLLDEE